VRLILSRMCLQIVRIVPWEFHLRLVSNLPCLVPTSNIFLALNFHPLVISVCSRSLEAAVQAVTAPNYVLEESLSSQLLWKDTAGNRPPQPLEERAFFEKMWAQNFARSQVEYRMPVEVLTATTPISLSPFADGNFDTAAAIGTELSNYNLAVNPPHSDGNPGGGGGIGGGGGGMNTSNVAEATLVSRLNDPSQAHRVGSVSGSGSDGHGNFLRHEIINRTVTGSDGQMTVLIKGDNVFGTTVSKSFVRPSMYGGPIAGVDTVNISVASYRVVEVRSLRLVAGLELLLGPL
jgi:hypothetical protein